MDRMTIVGSDGKPRYQIIGERVVDLMTPRCAHTETMINIIDTRPETGTQVICKECGVALGTIQKPKEE